MKIIYLYLSNPSKLRVKSVCVLRVFLAIYFKNTNSSSLFMLYLVVLLEDLNTIINKHVYMSIFS